MNMIRQDVVILLMQHNEGGSLKYVFNPVQGSKSGERLFN